MSTQSIYEQWTRRAAEKIEKKAPNSARMFVKAQNSLPGGDTRSITFFKPFPLFMDRGEGFKLYDIDGNVYIDFLNNYAALIHGNAHPGIVKAAKKQIEKGASFAGPTRAQYVLAEMICERVKAIERVRFCNSGTEATMTAIRAARTISGKSKIVKMEGGYHGTHDLAEVSVQPNLDEIGPIQRPISVPQCKGIPASILEEVIIVPFNNKAVIERAVTEHQAEIACVIIEPMLGAAGCIPPEPGYLKFVRDLTKKLDILLVYDEVLSFRIAYGGVQEIYGIEPDLTSIGKIIGGGFPVGAIGGPEEIMKVYSPMEKGAITHSGTFNGNPVTMEAGVAALEALTPKKMEHINALGDRFRNGIDAAFEKSGIKGRATGMGSLSQPHFNALEIKDYRSAQKGNFHALALVHLALLEKGFNMAPRGETTISTPMTEKEINAFLNAFMESMAEVKPFVEQTSPELTQ